MPLTFKLSFEHFDFNDEEFLNDLKRVNHFYDNSQKHWCRNRGLRCARDTRLTLCALGTRGTQGSGFKSSPSLVLASYWRESCWFCC